MSVLFSNDDTLTIRNIIDSYVSAYYSVHNQKPDCVALDSKWFLVNNEQRDRRWLVLEVERLRQEALTSALTDDALQKPSNNLFRLIRRLSRL